MRRLLVTRIADPNPQTQAPSYGAFASCCRYVIGHCWEEIPPLASVGPDHFSACWCSQEIRNGLIIEKAQTEGSAA